MSLAYSRKEPTCMVKMFVWRSRMFFRAARGTFFIGMGGLQQHQPRPGKQEHTQGRGSGRGGRTSRKGGGGDIILRTLRLFVVNRPLPSKYTSTAQGSACRGTLLVRVARGSAAKTYGDGLGSRAREWPVFPSKVDANTNGVISLFSAHSLTG